MGHRPLLRPGQPHEPAAHRKSHFAHPRGIDAVRDRAVVCLLRRREHQRDARIEPVVGNVDQVGFVGDERYGEVHLLEQINDAAQEYRMHGEDAVRAELMDQLFKPVADHDRDGALHRLAKRHAGGIIERPRLLRQPGDRTVGLFGADLLHFGHQVEAVDRAHLDVRVGFEALHQGIRDALVSVAGVHGRDNQESAHFLFSIL